MSDGRPANCQSCGGNLHDSFVWRSETELAVHSVCGECGETYSAVFEAV